jgi:hypothetical protein
MKHMFLFILTIVGSLSLQAQVTNPEFDSTLARKLGGDEYGMKMYVLVILKTGPAKIEAGARRDSLFAGHMNNITRCVKLNKLVVAGPLEKNDNSYRGIFIFNVSTFEEARALMEPDPTIKEKIFEPEFFMWYGSAALPEYLEASRKISRKMH